ncbi:hypothetical protein [Pseudomonas tohonis]|uniref:hypothetical protein n=1 Tax=Pseudomonas tohonis TaxID=2725477 RepID=UPI001F237D82|nr:hypothetical protein [Pseudomonas tohonis]
MAYSSGSANDMGAVRTALTSACVAEGWSWNESTEMLSKGSAFVRLQIVSGFLTLLGRTSATGGDAPSVVRMGPMGTTAITWPVQYHFFIFEMEVYCVIRFNVDFFLWCAFGKSTVEELPGTGMWVAASVHAMNNTYPDMLPNAGPTQSYVYGCTGIFWRTVGGGGSDSESWVHSDIDGQGWLSGLSETSSNIGVRSSAPLLSILPSSWNSEAVLLPIRVFKSRLEGKVSLTVDLLNARYTRIDNYAPGEVIQIGDERWMVLPFLRKNSAARDGGIAVNHTGTLGWAIRYEGP